VVGYQTASPTQTAASPSDANGTHLRPTLWRGGLLGGQQVWRVRSDRRHDLVDRRIDQRVRADHDGRDGLAATGSPADQCRRILVVPDVDLVQR
jgi:hypothetical protein